MDRPRHGFQSLIGFKINWNTEKKENPEKTGAFQSLIGFKINWNMVLKNRVKEFTEVSIPNRV